MIHQICSRSYRILDRDFSKVDGRRARIPPLFRKRWVRSLSIVIDTFLGYPDDDISSPHIFVQLPLFLRHFDEEMGNS